MIQLFLSIPWWVYPLSLLGFFFVCFTITSIFDIDVLGIIFCVIGNIIVFPLMLYVFFIIGCRRLRGEHETEFYIIPFTDTWISIFEKVFNMEISQDIDVHTVENVFGRKEPVVDETTYVIWR